MPSKQKVTSRRSSDKSFRVSVLYDDPEYDPKIDVSKENVVSWCKQQLSAPASFTLVNIGRFHSGFTGKMQTTFLLQMYRTNLWKRK
jgi:hypothetical protein